MLSDAPTLCRACSRRPTATTKDLTAWCAAPAPAAGDASPCARVGDDGRLLAREEVQIGGRRRHGAGAHLTMPCELRNRATAIAIEGEASAGAVLLLDERWRRRPVGIVAPRRARRHSRC